MIGTNVCDRIVNVDGMKIHLLEWGDPGRPTLVLLHGIARVAHTFDHLAPYYAKARHVVAIDMRGHGDSAWDPQAQYTVEDYTKDVAGVITQLGLRDIVLWGNSTGGRVVQMIGGTMPERVKAVIVEDVGPERPAEVSNRRASRMAVEAAGWATEEELAAHIRRDYPRTRPALLENFVRHGSMRNADGRIVLKRDPAILKGFTPTELWDTVRRVRAPIIYILGGASTIVPQETQTKLREVLPQVQIVTMPGLGHYPSDEEPEAFRVIVDEFLAKIR